MDPLSVAGNVRSVYFHLFGNNVRLSRSVFSRLAAGSMVHKIKGTGFSAYRCGTVPFICERNAKRSGGKTMVQEWKTLCRYLETRFESLTNIRGGSARAAEIAADLVSGH